MERRWIWVLLLALIMGIFPACGAQKSMQSELPPAAETPQESAVEFGETAIQDKASSGSPLEITLSTGYAEEDPEGEIISFFAWELSEITDGAITVEVFWDGSMYTDAQALDGIAEGEANMATLQRSLYDRTMIYLSIPGSIAGGAADAVEYFNKLMFEDPAASAMMQGEAAACGIVYTGLVAGWPEVFCASREFQDLETLVSASGGIGTMEADLFQNLGFRTVIVRQDDLLDAMQRGYIGAACGSLRVMAGGELPRYIPYWAKDGSCTIDSILAANLTWWNALETAQREAVLKAAQEAQRYGAKLMEDAAEQTIQAVEEETRVSFIEFSEDDIREIQDRKTAYAEERALGLADSTGKAEEMKQLLAVAAALREGTDG